MGTQPRDQELLRAFLAERDEPCPKCGYNLRGAASAECPECGERCELVIRRPGLPRGAAALAAVLLALEVVIWGYYGVTTVVFFGGAMGGPSRYYGFMLGEASLVCAGCIAGLVLAARMRRRGAPGRAARFLVVYTLILVNSTLLLAFASQFVWRWLM